MRDGSGIDDGPGLRARGPSPIPGPSGLTRRRTLRTLDRNLHSHLLVCFVILLAGNSVLSYVRLPAPILTWIALMTIILPTAYWFGRNWTTRTGGSLPVYRREVPFAPGPWALLLLALAALGVRFYHLTSLTVWPYLDEAVVGFLGLELFENWHWRLFSYCSQLPPFYFWFQGGVSSSWNLPFSPFGSLRPSFPSPRSS